MNALRYILALLMLCIFMFRDFSRPIIAADYLVNLERYKQACINKLKPKMGCNGRCQMMRKMGASDGSAAGETMPPTKPFLGESVFDAVIVPPSLALHSDINRHVCRRLPDNYYFSHTDDIFHPPSINA
jgi:hypothetical protein